MGTGTFITQLLQSGLIKPEDLHRKYTQELFANEIVLLSYYIAAINIETVYAEEATRHGVASGYVSFDGIALTDTFQLNETDGQLGSNGFFPENHERVTRQKNQDIRVIVMNPPYSSGQSSANDNNQNQKYPVLDESIANTYAKLSTATLKNSLYDSYIRGIRWASNRIKDDGVIAFVSNGSFIDGNTADGIRKTFATEFSRVFIYNLRGNQRTSGEQSGKEGGKIFGSGSRTQVAIAILIKNSAHTDPADIQYKDIGDYLTRDQKLDVLSIEQSLEGTDWESITPNEHGDWVNHRDERYDTFQPIGDKTTKGKKGTIAIFEYYSREVATSRDAWCYNFSRAAVDGNMSRSITFYDQQVVAFQDELIRNPGAEVEDFIDFDSTKFTWDRINKTDARRGKQGTYENNNLVLSAYRQFAKQWLYCDQNNQFNNCVYQIPRMFPTSEHSNLAIYLSSPGASKQFSSFIVDCIPNLHLIHTGSAYSLYTYEHASSEAQGDLFAEADSDIVNGYRRKDNITDATVATCHDFYKDPKLGKEDIFYYVYGLMHSPVYRARYSAVLMKMLPRIPKVKNFWGFSTAGRALAKLHLNYETVMPYPLEEITAGSGASDDAYDFYRVKKLSFVSRKDRSKIVYNQNITLAGIPEEAYEYQVNGKSAWSGSSTGIRSPHTRTRRSPTTPTTTLVK